MRPGSPTASTAAISTTMAHATCDPTKRSRSPMPASRGKGRTRAALRAGRSTRSSRPARMAESPPMVIPIASAPAALHASARRSGVRLRFSDTIEIRPKAPSPFRHPEPGGTLIAIAESVSAKASVMACRTIRPRPGAQRQPGGEFPLPRRRESQQQVHQVEAGDQQHGRRQRCEQRHVAHRGFPVSRKEARLLRGQSDEPRVRVSLRDRKPPAASEARRARPEAPVRVTPGFRRAVIMSHRMSRRLRKSSVAKGGRNARQRRHRHPHRGRLAPVEQRAGKTARHHSHHRHRHVRPRRIVAPRAAALRSKPALPEPVADHRHGQRARPVVFRSERTAARRAILPASGNNRRWRSRWQPVPRHRPGSQASGIRTNAVAEATTLLSEPRSR